jgi:hypothetical protein
VSRDTLLLVEKCSHCFSWYDIESGERLRTLTLAEFPHEFVTDRDARFAYVGHYGVETSGHTGAGGHAIFQTDIRSGQLVRSIDLYPFNRIHGLQIDAQDRLYALSEEKATLLVLDAPATDTAAKRAVPSGGIKSHLFALTRDGQTAHCMNLLSHTVTKVKPWDPLFAPVACHPGQKPEGYCLSGDERTLFVSNRWSNTLCAIDTETMAVRHSAASRDDVTRIYRAHDGRLFTSNYGDGLTLLVSIGIAGWAQQRRNVSIKRRIAARQLGAGAVERPPAEIAAAASATSSPKAANEAAAH